MEIKLNQYTLPLLCSLVSAVTYIIICRIKQNDHGEKGKAAKAQHQDKDSDEEDEYDNYINLDRKARKDSVRIHKTRLSGDENTAANNLKLLNESYSSEYNKDDEDENDDPAQMLEERQKRCRQLGAGGRRGTIAFEDELRATIKKDLKAEEDGILVNGIDKTTEEAAAFSTSSSEPKSILKTASDMASDGQYYLRRKKSFTKELFKAI